jgi:hypothetical protein
MKERDPKGAPEVIDEISRSLGEHVPKNMQRPTVEGIAEKVGISKNILYDWVKTDTELSEALGRFKTIQEEDPFKTGTYEDAWIGSLVIAFILIETRDRHVKHSDSSAQRVE